MTEIVCVGELFRVLFEPLPKSVDTFRTNMGIQVAETVDEDPVQAPKLASRHCSIFVPHP